ncbi:transglutaminase domain-containing protein [Chloroflexota bacterium]
MDGFFQFSENSFDPIITRESLGENIDVAWEMGESFIDKYPEPNQRAQQIFYFVRDRVSYTSDREAFGYDEFAQNADELAGTIQKKGKAVGDCEDYAVLLAVLYKAAGFRSAIVLVPEHAAALVYLPDYTKAKRDFTVGGERGWIWAEATGSTNDLGWFSSRRLGKSIMARELSEEALPLDKLTFDPTSAKRVHPTGGFASKGVIWFFGVVGVLWILSVIRRGTARRRHWNRGRQA